MKLPWIKFFPSDWFSDVGLQACSALTRGVWFDLIMRMHMDGQKGVLSGTISSFAAWGRCTEDEAVFSIEQLRSLNVASVTCNALKQKCNEVVTVVNRRMQKEYKSRISTKDRVVRYREKIERVTVKKRSCNAVEARSQMLEVRKEDKNPPSPKGVPTVVLTPSVEAVFQEWQKHRRGMGKNPKNWDAMFAKQAEWLAGCSPEAAIESMNQSMRNNWQGLFEPKASSGKLSATKAGSEKRDYTGELK